MPVELRHIRVFHAVAAELSFRRAAERLNIAQPALSRTVRDLELLLGTTLFLRTTRSVRLTAAGQSFLKDTEGLLSDLENAIHRAHRVQSGTAGELRVGFNDFAMNGMLPEVIRYFRVDAPGVEVTLVDTTTPDMIERLLDRRLDIAFYSGPHSHPQLDQLILREEELVCVLPTTHALASRDTISIRDLATENFVLGRLEMWRVFHQKLREFCLSHGFDLSLVKQAEHSDGIIALVAAGIGLTLHVDADWIHNRRGVAVRPLKEKPPRIVTQGAWRRDRLAENALIGKFVDSARSVIARNRGPERQES